MITVSNWSVGPEVSSDPSCGGERLQMIRLLTICTALLYSPVWAREKSGRFLSLFSVVQFRNSECLHNKTLGVCVTTSQVSFNISSRVTPHDLVSVWRLQGAPHTPPVLQALVSAVFFRYLTSVLTAFSCVFKSIQPHHLYL